MSSRGAAPSPLGQPQGVWECWLNWEGALPCPRLPARGGGAACTGVRGEPPVVMAWVNPVCSLLLRDHRPEGQEPGPASH